MILYIIKNGIIEVEEVAKETKCGWRQLNNGFYNKSELGEYVYLDKKYLTTDYDKALSWAKKIRSYIADVIQVSSASIDDINNWNENGAYQDELPKSRMVYGKVN